MKWEKQELLEALKNIEHKRAISPNWQDRGICYFIADELQGKLDKLFEKWPKFSGDPSYPVPAPTSESEWHPALHDAPLRSLALYSFNYLPRWKGEYGELRKELLAFCISELEKDVQSYATNFNGDKK